MLFKNTEYPGRWGDCSYHNHLGAGRDFIQKNEGGAYKS
jgi:hypothetical protein